MRFSGFVGYVALSAYDIFVISIELSRYCYHTTVSTRQANVIVITSFQHSSLHLVRETRHIGLVE